MYTVWLGNRSHVVSDQAATKIAEALNAGLPMVEVEMVLGSPGSPAYTVTVNTSHVIALVRHHEGLDADVTPDRVVVPLRSRG